MKYKSILYFFLFGVLFCYAQDPIDDLRLGFGIKLTGEYQHNFGLKFRVSATGGIAKYLDLSKNDFGLLPTAHVGILLYNRGILGSNLARYYKHRVFLDFFADTTITMGGKNITQRNRVENRRVPLYHFSDFTANPLQNTFQHAVSFGRNWIFNPDKNRSAQRIGFFNLNIARTVQLSYYNDGGPVLDILGDKQDRYYTGGLVISAHFNENTYFDKIELSFHKFTGWQEYAVDVSDKLQLDHIPYKNREAIGFNQQRWSLKATNFKQDYSAYVSVYDVNVWDLQDILHFSRDFPYHPDYFYGYRIAAGIEYFNLSNTN